MKCEICGKIPQFGFNVSHSKRHTRRQWKPNVSKRNLVIDGEPARVKICTRCLRTLQKVKA